METCPHCGKPVCDYWRKLCTGPLVTQPCPACGRKIGLNPMAWVGCGCLVVGFLATVLGWQRDPTFSGAAFVAGFVLFMILYKTSVRFVRKE